MSRRARQAAAATEEEEGGGSTQPDSEDEQQVSSTVSMSCCLSLSQSVENVDLVQCFNNNLKTCIFKSSGQKEGGIVIHIHIYSRPLSPKNVRAW